MKEFYLRVKIANIRKRLTENESLNDELVVDKRTHKDVFNVKLLVKALEEVAELEQEALLKEEKERRAKALENMKLAKSTTPTANESCEVETPRSITSAENASKAENGADYKDMDPPSMTSSEIGKSKENTTKTSKKKDLLGL